MSRGDLFPEIEPFAAGFLPLEPVIDGRTTNGEMPHVMYWEQVGRADGRPVLFLHGGPGAGAGIVHRRFFDPHVWRAVIFDQRGAGRSRPQGSLRANDTDALVNDIETLRRHLGIESWVLFGGSWGSTLALSYAQAYPERVVALVLRGIFLGRPPEMDWFLYGLRSVFPDAHAIFAQHVPEAERGDLLTAYLSRLVDPDPAIHLPASRAWSVYEGTCSTLLPTPGPVTGFSRDRAALGLARIEAYYFRNGLFLPPEGLLGRMDRIAHLPVEIVQGRYDMVCPPVSAFDLAASWSGARLTMVPDAGHSALEPGTRRALIAALERFRG
ncbi:prolyl aminopeptidase [Lichenicola cladoniae]|uniref:Proline iminopeptidase n=1 Tax=Lichenicola cladoniae TaxID=1484109 RepID=A0A6M8HRA5_9PROT|nr:prolyl aminopeptidase [Lichenicola cladoniae]NPD69165.1 prolyl aminopeptidase [Acetobacteraceae bacterium]QKE90984.1 prolyl aminopeptidase [Lichenicola cladoniae]